MSPASPLALLAAALVAAPLCSQALGGPPPEDIQEAKPPPKDPPRLVSTDAKGDEDDRIIAVRAAKILTAAREGDQVIRDGLVIFRDGKLIAVGPADEIEIPVGAELIDVGDRFVMPGFVELHCHVGAPAEFFPTEINSAVYLANPGLRVSASVVPDNRLLRRAIAGGVTTVLYIPGSGSNIGGQGVLLKLGHDTYEAMELRNPGSLKLAQAGNPESWGPGVGRSFQNWHTRGLFLKGRAYARAWESFESGEGEAPDVDPMLEVFRPLFSGETQVSTHTQFYQVVLMTITMVKIQMGLDVFIDHGTFGGFKAAALAEEHGVPAIVGPRMIATSMDSPVFEQLDTDGRVLGICAEYQKRGHRQIGFNTDCVDNGMRFNAPAQEELSLQAAMALRYGMTNFELESIRGLTIVPAETAGLGDRVGSLEVGKDADLVVIDGDPADPRTSVSLVFTDGKLVYDATEVMLW